MANSSGADRRNQDNRIHPGIKITLIVAAILCVVMLVYAICDAAGIVDRNTTAMTVGEDEISSIELKQYYYATRNAFMVQNGPVLSMYGIDVNNPMFESQPCLYDSNKTWREYFMDEAEETAREVSILYQEAQKNGYTMTAEDQEMYDSYFASMADAAEEADFSVKKYIRLVYGSGTKLSDVEDYYAKRCLSAGYYETIVEGFGIDDKAIDAYYQEHTDDYDVKQYYLYDVPYTKVTFDASKTEEGAPASEEEAKKQTEDNKAAAKADAEALLAKMKADGSNFDEEAARYENAEEGKFQTAYVESTISSITAGTIGDWLKDDARKAGDMTVLEDEQNSSYSLLLYMGEELPDDYSVAIRHVLLKTEQPAEDADEEAKKAAETKNAEIKANAEQLLKDWEAAGATEDAFAAMAKEHSEDGNAMQGGIYEGVTKGRMVESFDAWCFDESRKPGDHGIVETEYGYHLMYFVENEGPVYRTSIRHTLEQGEYDQYLTEHGAEYPMTLSKSALALF